MSSSATAVRLARSLPGLLREVEAGPATAPLLVGGPPSAVMELSRGLAEGGDSTFVRQVRVDGLAAGDDGVALVHVIKGAATPTDERVLREADRRRLPIVCLVLAEEPGGARVLPYVRATDVVHGVKIDNQTIAAVAARVAARTGEAAWELARGLPVLRRAVAEALVVRFSRQNAMVGAAVFVPGADLPILTLNELRMVLRIAAAYGLAPDRARRVALAAVVGVGFGLRGIARRAVQLVPLPAFALKAGVAYAGTRAIGLAAIALAEREAVSGTR